ncbi:MAG: CNNM domain-containing protein [Candidatus Saccharimonadales bacterium]
MSVLIPIIVITLLVGFSAVCSGLNIALMSIDISDLRRKAKLGNRSAARILPLRRNTHLTLSSLLLINVAAVSATSLVLESYLNGIIAGILSTLLIVVFGEVLPQTVFAKNPLRWVSFFVPLLTVMTIVAYPISKPLQLLLNKIIGPRKNQLQSRHELGLLITEHLGADSSELDEDEVEIIRGALQLSEKHIHSIMTPIDQVYWLSPDTKLTGKRIDEIKAKGFSRIPVFDAQTTKCYGVMLMKELIDIDFDSITYRVDEMPLHAVGLVGSRTALDTMFRKFISVKTHLMPVERSDKIVGVVTIEDLIEEILGHEIEDESDHIRQTNKARTP